MKVFHVCLKDEEQAEDFLKGLDNFESNTSCSETDGIVAELREAIEKEFNL